MIAHAAARAVVRFARARAAVRRHLSERANSEELSHQLYSFGQQQLIMRWATHSVAELQEFLEAFGLPTSGVKSELVSRLEASTVAEHVRAALAASCSSHVPPIGAGEVSPGGSGWGVGWEPSPSAGGGTTGELSSPRLTHSQCFAAPGNGSTPPPI